MRIVSGIIFSVLLVTLSSVFAIEDRHRRRHGHGKKHGHRHSHEHRHGHHSDDDGWDDGDDNKHITSVQKKCKRSGLVALTFDDGVV